jgi:trimethylamine-N-oxide reductase (cytochrome c)
MRRLLLRTILFGLACVLRLAARVDAGFRRELRRHDMVAQIRLKDGSLGRWYAIENGRVWSRAGVHPRPDVTMAFKDLATAFVFLVPPPDQSEIVHAAKQFRVVVDGRDELVVWFMQLLNRITTIGLEQGRRMPDGTTRYTTCTNGGPLFVYVKDGRIVRLTPIDLDDSDAPSWTIRARGKSFTPWRRATVNPHAMNLKSLVYSDKRLLHPMKRVDFDPNGERNPQNRGKSGYVRISWDEAFDLVANEIKRQKREHGPAAMAIYHSLHRQRGNVGYYLSALPRFGNLVEDCLRECEMIVFWSSDPETTSGAYAGAEGTQRRLWAKQLGVEFVHIDPHCTPTAQLLGGRWIPIRPAWSRATRRRRSSIRSRVAPSSPTAQAA